MIEGQVRQSPQNRMDQFVNAYLTYFDGPKAALEAGYSKTTAKFGWRQIFRHSYVQSKIAEKAREAKNVSGYDVKTAMEEADTLMHFCMSQGNSMAAVKASELKMRLCGLLIEQVDMRATLAFEINISGLGAPKPLNALEPISLHTPTLADLQEGQRQLFSKRSTETLEEQEQRLGLEPKAAEEVIDISMSEATP